MSNSKLSRRDFLKGSAVIGGMVAGSALLSACSAQDAAQDEDAIVWDKEADVVVIGYGGAGAATAITAHDAGSQVLLLEKTETGGGNTSVSLGGFLNVTDSDLAYKYTTKLFDYSLAEMDEEIIRVFTTECARNAEWVSALEPGMTPMKYGGASYKSVEGSETQEKYQIPREGMRTGASLFAAYKYAVEEDRGIEVMFSTPAQRLITDKDGAVIGVVAESNGSTINIKARKGVALTCGGYEFDDTMKQNTLKGYPVRAAGWPANTGDGIRMAQEVGAGLWHMNGASCSFAFETDPDLPMCVWNQGGAGILVDKHAKRFTNEVTVESHACLLATDVYDSHAMEYPRIPCFHILDESLRQTKKFGFESSGNLGNHYKWSDDNLAEIEKGWIIKADTLEELAGKLGLDPEALVATVEKYNADIKNGLDTEFGREVKQEEVYGVMTGTIPLETAPYYGIVLYPTLLNTQGGPRRNAQAQVLDAFGEPIPRLYSAGEIGSFWGIIYQGSGNNAESMVFGRIAGANLAALDPWDAEE